MTHHFTGEAGASLVFAVLYSALFAWMLSSYLTGRYKWKSRWSLLFFHVTIRVASQALGVAFGILVFSNTDVFAAYLILGAEGYFTLTLAGYLFLKSWHMHNWSDSWLLSKDSQRPERRKGNILRVILMEPVFMPWKYKDHVLAPVHSILTPANAIIIAGGSMLANLQSESNHLTAADIANRKTISKILRCVGAGLFLCMKILFNACVWITICRNRREKGKIHPTLIVLAIMGQWLTVRGIFGLLQSAIDELSYTNPENYTSDGFKGSFSAYETACGVLPECAAAYLLNATWFTSRHDAKQSAYRQQQQQADEGAIPPTENKVASGI